MEEQHTAEDLMDKAELAEALFEALAAGDDEHVRALCTADVQIQQNNSPPMDLDSLLELSRSVHRVVKDFRYEGARRSETAVGFVEEHRVCGVLPDGSKLDLAVCVVGDVRDGRICGLREYLDMAAAAGLLAALS